MKVNKHIHTHTRTNTHKQTRTQRHTHAQTHVHAATIISLILMLVDEASQVDNTTKTAAYAVDITADGQLYV